MSVEITMCPTCDGRAWISPQGDVHKLKPCPTCEGTGRVAANVERMEYSPLVPRTCYAASPALAEQSKGYPANYRGRVPKKIKMAKTVYPDLPWMTGIKPGTMLELDQTYFCWVNIHGAVAGWCDNGEKLGVKPSEFDVVEWYDAKPHNDRTEARGE